jgi:hypothetical protein
MILKSVLFLLPSLLLGILFIFWFWPAAISKNVLLKLVLGIISGLGFHSILTTWGFLFYGLPWKILLGLESFFILTLIMLCVRKFKGPLRFQVDLNLKSWLTSHGYVIGFGILCFVNALTFIGLTFLKPMGNFDAYAIWNLKAKLIFLNPTNWTQALNHPSIIFFHPDYPLMLPVLVSDLWLKIGTMTTRAPMVLAVLFTFCLPILLFAVVKNLRDDSQAFLAGSLMLAAPYLFQFGGGQTADVPLAVYVLAAILLIVLAFSEEHWQLYALSGLMAGFAGWSKNEGMMFAGVLFLLLVIVFILSKDLKKLSFLLFWIVGLLIPILTILVFKNRITVANELFNGSFMDRILDWGRYPKVLMGIGMQLINWGGWKIPILPVFLVYAALMRKNLSTEKKKTFLFTNGFILFSIAGFFAIYLITPYPLEWHLKYSSDRLMFQLYPVFILGLMFFTKSISELRKGNSHNLSS